MRKEAIFSLEWKQIHSLLTPDYFNWIHTGQLLGLNTRADRLLNHKLIIHQTFSQQSASLSAQNAEQIIKATLTDKFAHSSGL